MQQNDQKLTKFVRQTSCTQCEYRSQLDLTSDFIELFKERQLCSIEVEEKIAI